MAAPLSQHRLCIQRIEQDSAGAYWYDDRDTSKINVPTAAKFDGNINKHSEKLDEYIMFRSDLQPLPKFLIHPRLDSTWNYSRDDGWDITGKMVVYEPIEWAPIVVSDWKYPKDAFTKIFEETEVSRAESKLCGKVSSELQIYSGVKLLWSEDRSKVKAEASVEATLKTERIQKIKPAGKQARW